MKYRGYFVSQTELICLNDECLWVFQEAGYTFIYDDNNRWFCSIECLIQDEELNERDRS